MKVIKEILGVRHWDTVCLHKYLSEIDLLVELLLVRVPFTPLTINLEDIHYSTRMIEHGHGLFQGVHRCHILGSAVPVPVGIGLGLSA